MFATCKISKGQFICKYEGLLQDYQVSDAKLDQTYIYYFTIGKKNYRYETNLDVSVMQYKLSKRSSVRQR